MSKTIRPPVKWWGGKHYLAKQIVALLPEHHTYVEPYGGGASVLLNKPPAPVEVWNDLNRQLYTMFWALREHPDELRRLLALTPYSEAEFGAASEGITGRSVEGARRFYVRCRQSFGGRGESFSATKHRVRRGMADVVSGYLSAIDEQLPLIVERLRTVQILCRPAVDVIRGWDSPDTLIYCDPPYLPETRQTADAYECEMTRKDHEAMLAALVRCVGKVALSGYANELYDSFLGARSERQWSRHEFDLPNNAAGGKRKRRMTEVLWTNWWRGG